MNLEKLEGMLFSDFFKLMFSYKWELSIDEPKYNFEFIITHIQTIL